MDRRLFVVSDLHLGGTAPHMMSRPERLATFIGSLPQRCNTNESLELVIAGDFVDFLAIAPHASWTPDPKVALEKLSTVTDRDPCTCVFDALREHASAGHKLTVLVGNHDVELALPAVQDALEARVGPMRFVDDGSAYRVGRLLIEHGNRYDPPNENDWGALRAIRSAQSRFESPRHELEVSNGSQLVDRVLNRFKADYPFLDLIQPQNEFMLYLLLALEPALRNEVRALAYVWQSKRLADSAAGKAPASIRKVGARTDALATVFPELHEALLDQGIRKVSARNWLATVFAPAENGLAAKFRRGEAPTAQDLANLRIVAQEALVVDTTELLGNVDDWYAKAAGDILTQSSGAVETVIMGHTHLAREVGPAIEPSLLPEPWRDRIEHARERGAHEIALYINTGTWADRVRLDFDRLDDDAYLTTFLRGLVNDERPALVAHYADVAIAPTGKLRFARLGEDRAP